MRPTATEHGPAILRRALSRLGVAITDRLPAGTTDQLPAGTTDQLPAGTTDRLPAETGGRHRAETGDRRRGEDGFILLESLISIGLIGVIMAALTTLFVTTSQTTTHLRLKQEAIQLANNAIEQVQAYPAGSLVVGRGSQSVADQFASAPTALSGMLSSMTQSLSDPNAVGTSGATSVVAAATSPQTCPTTTTTTAYLPTSPVCQAVGNHAFYLNYYLGTCYMASGGNGSCLPGNAANLTYQRVVVSVTWTSDRCESSNCRYSTSTLVNTDPDPQLDLGHAGGGSPSINVSDRTDNAGDLISLPSPTLADGTGVAPFTWTATGLPPGLTMASDGTVTGTITDPGVASKAYPVTVTVVDGAIQTSSATFVWTVVRPSIVTPPDQSTVINTAVSLQVLSTCLKQPCTYTMTNPPAGLSISNTGLITGTPNMGGTVTMTVTVTDGNGVSATTSPFQWVVLMPATVCVPEIALANGSFESPVVSHGAPNWLTGGTSPLLWDTTEPDNVIELWKNDGAGPQTGLTAQAANGGKAISAQDGTQWAELNANQTGALYQDLTTVPGQILQWSVWHRGRYSSAANAVKKDVMQVQIGSTTKQTAQVPTGQTSADISDGPDAWSLYRGIYTVPAGQTLTRFQFAAITTASGDNSIGNFIDNLALNNYVACLNNAPTDQVNTVNTAIPSLQLSASRGSGKFVWGGGSTLPAGLSITSDGLITGTPTTPGTSSVQLTLTDTQTTFVQSVSFKWTVVAKPTVAAPPTQTTSSGGNVSLQLSTDCQNVPCSYAMDGGPAGLTVSNTGLINGTVTSAAQTFGSATVTVRDNQGVLATTAPFRWIVNPAPTMSGPGDQKSLRGAGVYLNVAGLASGGTGSYSFTAAGLPSWLSLSSTGVITGTAPASADSTTTGITVTVTDSTGASGTSAAFSWTVYSAPTITSPGNQASSVGTPVSLPLTSTCPNSPCTYTLANAPTGLSISSTGTITGTISGTGKTYTGVVVTITDAGGASNSTGSFSWLVNPAPKLLSPGNQRALHGATVSLAMATYASGGTGAYTYTATNLPSWLTINSATGVISGKAPTGADTTTTGIVITLTDATRASSSTAAFSWTVNNALALPFSNQTSYKNSTVNLDLDNYTTGGTGPYTYSASGLPSWLTLNTRTGVLSGTAPSVSTNTTTKTANIVLTVTDSLGTVASSSPFTWYVSDLTWIGYAANGSSFSTARGTSLNGFNAASYVSGGASGARTYSAISLPTGISVASDGTIAGTASTAGTWRTQLTVTDSAGAVATSSITWTVN